MTQPDSQKLTPAHSWLQLAAAARDLLQAAQDAQDACDHRRNDGDGDAGDNPRHSAVIGLLGVDVCGDRFALKVADGNASVERDKAAWC